MIRLLLVALCLGMPAIPVLGGTLDFEDLADQDTLTNQYPGLTFSNAIALTAGISLNEFDFPPASGVNVVSDNGGPLEIVFATPALSFSGYFTYVVPLTLEVFDTGNTSVAVIPSLFSANDGFTGEFGSSPNELLQFAYAAGISRVLITGDAFGSSFTMDDVTFESSGAPIPEPDTGSLALIALGGLGLWRCLFTNLLAG